MIRALQEQRSADECRLLHPAPFSVARIQYNHSQNVTRSIPLIVQELALNSRISRLGSRAARKVNLQCSRQPWDDFVWPILRRSCICHCLRRGSLNYMRACIVSLWQGATDSGRNLKRRNVVRVGEWIEKSGEGLILVAQLVQLVGGQSTSLICQRSVICRITGLHARRSGEGSERWKQSQIRGLGLHNCHFDSP